MNRDQTQNRIYTNLVTVNGAHMPWLTMIHGFSQTHHYFSAQVPRFQQDFRLFLADLRGHGQSAAVEGPYGIEEYAEDIITSLDDAGIEQTHYCTRSPISKTACFACFRRDVFARVRDA